MTQFDPSTLEISPLHMCSYLPDRASRLAYLPFDEQMKQDNGLFTQLAQLGFRRSGDVVYRPVCQHCGQCIACRVVVNEFNWSRRFRKVLGRNSDVSVRLIDSNQATAEHYALFERYIIERHADGDMYPPSLHTFKHFLVDSPAPTKFLEIRQITRKSDRTQSPVNLAYSNHLSKHGKLLAIAVTDVLEDGLSSVYTFFDTHPNFKRRSLGVLGVLKQIQLARLLGLPYVYLGYWIPEHPKMSYKSQYLPLDLLINNEWRVFNTPPHSEDIFQIIAKDRQSNTRPIRFIF